MTDNNNYTHSYNCSFDQSPPKDKKFDKTKQNSPQNFPQPFHFLFKFDSCKISAEYSIKKWKSKPNYIETSNLFID